MATKDLKPRMFCTALDVRNWYKELTSSIISDQQIEFFIYRATNIIRMHLLRVYDDSELRTSSWAGIPMPNSDDETSFLYGASAGASAYTELFTITCATASFSVSGNLQGSLSSVAYTSNLATSDLSILASAWASIPASEEVYLVSTYDVYPVIMTLTSMLAASYVLNSKFTEEMPNASSYGDKLETRVMEWLKKLDDPSKSNGLAFDSSARFDLSLDPDAVPYEIDEEGKDVTDYYPNTGSQKGEENVDLD